jgi:type IV pilus assembly protein PilC
MAVFVWEGRNRYGDLVRGERVARSQEELTRVLQREQITVSSVGKKGVKFKIPFLKRERVSLKELAIYSRQLSVLIDADLPLIQSLNMLAEQTRNKYFKGVIQTIRRDVEAGSTLNQAKKKYPKVFDDLYCNLVASGEQSGSLDVMLRRLSEFLEKILKLRSQVKQAMTYPVVILAFSIVVVIFMMWKVVPIFSGIFVELGANMPFLTRIILGISVFIQKYILVVFVAIIVAVFLFRYFVQTPTGKSLKDTVTLRIPLFGKLLEKVALSRITRTLSTLLSGGVPMLESLKITSSTAGNMVIEGRILEARSRVAGGASLMDALKERAHFPFMLTQMVGVGEATGNLDAMLSKLAEFYDEEVDSAVGSLLSVLEPILMIIIGGLVGTIVISMYLPVFSLMQQF